MYRLICQKPAHFLSAQMALLSTFFQMFIALGMYNLALSIACFVYYLTHDLLLPMHYLGQLSKCKLNMSSSCFRCRVIEYESLTFFPPILLFRSSHFLFLVFGHFCRQSHKNTKILHNLYFARQDGQNGKEPERKAHN